MQRYTRLPGLHVFIGNNIAHIYFRNNVQYLRVGECEGRTLIDIKLDIGMVWSLSASDATNKIAAGTSDSKVHIFDADSGELLNTMNLGNDMSLVDATLFSPNGRYIACTVGILFNNQWGNTEGTRIVVFDSEQKKDRKEFKFSADSRLGAHSLSFSQNNEYFSYVDFSGLLTIVNITTRSPIQRVRHKSPNNAPLDFYGQAILSPDGKYIIALAHVTYRLFFADFSGRNIFSYRYLQGENTQKYEAIKLTPDGERLAILSNNIVTFFDLKRRIPQFKIRITFVQSPTISFSEDSKKIMVSSSRGGTNFLKIPRDHYSILDHKSDLDALNITLLPEYTLKLQKDKLALDTLSEYKIHGKLADIVTSYT